MASPQLATPLNHSPVCIGLAALFAFMLCAVGHPTWKSRTVRDFARFCAAEENAPPVGAHYAPSAKVIRSARFNWRTARTGRGGIRSKRAGRTIIETVISNGPSTERFDLIFLGDGYTKAELPKFRKQVRTVLKEIFSAEPFASYASMFNAHLVFTPSKMSGLSSGADAGTPLGMRLGCYGLSRRLCIDTSKAFAAAEPLLAKEGVSPNGAHVAIIALANSREWAGTAFATSRGIGIATATGSQSGAGEIVLHELGHALGKLGDEYDYGGPENYTGADFPAAANLTIYSAAELGVRAIKWARWLGADDKRFGGLVNAFEGGGYHRHGVYRATEDSRMRSYGVEFNLPSIERLIAGIYSANPLRAVTPVETILDAGGVIKVKVAHPRSHRLIVRWSVDGVEVPGYQGSELRITALNLAPGEHTIGCSLLDPGTFIRDPELSSFDAWRGADGQMLSWAVRG